MTAPFADRPLEETLDRVAAIGCETVEIGTGGYPGDAHCRPDELLAASHLRRRFVRAIEDRGLAISALACHGNPLHPNREVARADDATLRQTIRLASLLGVDRVTAFSGCPGDSPLAGAPNWICVAFPRELHDVLEWQWAECVEPYWKSAADWAAEHAVRIAIEPHPGFCVYHLPSFWRLWEVCRGSVGVNLDPSHLLWQGADPIVWIRELSELVLHVHAKDVRRHAGNLARTGVLDTVDLDNAPRRAWTFCTVGRGSGQIRWDAVIAALADAGYDGTVSIEQHDPELDPAAGLGHAVDVLAPLIHERTGSSPTGAATARQPT
jgi:sugar phosphate isomerase/epimerase